MTLAPLVYYVDPRPEIARLGIEALQRGYQLDCVLLTDIEEAKKRLRRPSLRPRVVVLADGPPQGKPWNGVEECQTFQQDAALQSVPIILISTNSYYQHPSLRPRQALEAGAKAFLEIPFLTEELYQEIARLLAPQMRSA
jgi:CheY-like chemotaxis protein